MKKSVFWLIFFIILTGCMWQELEVVQLDKKEALFDVQNEVLREQEIYVYRTKTGQKYHRYGCRYLRNSCEEMNLRDVEHLGLKACSVCQPPP